METDLVTWSPSPDGTYLWPTNQLLRYTSFKQIVDLYNQEATIYGLPTVTLVSGFLFTFALVSDLQSKIATLRVTKGLSVFNFTAVSLTTITLLQELRKSLRDEQLFNLSFQTANGVGNVNVNTLSTVVNGIVLSTSISGQVDGPRANTDGLFSTTGVSLDGTNCRNTVITVTIHNGDVSSTLYQCIGTITALQDIFINGVLYLKGSILQENYDVTFPHVDFSQTYVITAAS